MKLRPYQIECLDKVREMNIGEKKICYLPTGSGKTVIMSAIANETKGRVLIVVMSTELRLQTIDKLKIICGDNVDVGSVQAEINETNAKIIIATRQSLTHPKSHRMEELLNKGNFNIVMIDECHIAISQYKKIIEAVGDNVKVIGMSATPWNDSLKGVFDGFVYQKELIEMIEEKYLCEPKCFAIQTDCDLSNVKTVGGEFVQRDLAEVVDNVARNELIVKSYIEKAKDRKQTIVFATSIDHATNLSNCFKLNGISSESIDSTVDKDARKQVFEDFISGKFKVLVNVNICSIGLDIPSVDCIILARPTKSKMLYVQQLGRGLRLSPETNKKNCLILDIVDNVKKFNLVNCKSIFDMENGETLEEAKLRKQYEKEEKERLLEEQKGIEEEEERLRLQEIELFNSRVDNILSSSTFDWFMGSFKYNNQYEDVAILSANSNIDHYVIKIDGEFQAFEYTRLKGYDFNLELIESNKDLLELMQLVQDKSIYNGSSFINKNSKWKYEEATEKQILACKQSVRTKWEAHKYFSKKNMYFALRDRLG
ncbi:hypothetical protein psyc5s11_36670 [Clostridium gelidum]|uniref:DEAD/DEAH box helicase n=1 Tax=Clostridium gelidum TaxID=704125 RepID=A0ABM7T6E2_9CLOT|nr:DEAD/DEAH box helicase [Clostridium gelidum]BCZ47600.1 hypothetical protein psyc5s11_36670 [Clostridium gelidum]